LRTILVTGAGGQVGSELVTALRKQYGSNRVVATDLKPAPAEAGPGETVDVTNANAVYEAVRRCKADTIVHLASLLSATAESKPYEAWRINMGGLLNVLEIARELGCTVFNPSSIAAFGPETPPDCTPQTTIQRPITMYGINKVAGELLGDYYFRKFGVDTRSLRFPGLVSHVAPPGGGTTDYAVEMYVEAASKHAYTSYIREGTFLDMMYMPDALNATLQLLEADPARLRVRNGYNVSAMSVDPAAVAESIRYYIPDFTLEYRVDSTRQAIADSWPNRLDTSFAEADWGFCPRYGLSEMTKDMLDHLHARHRGIRTAQ